MAEIVYRACFVTMPWELYLCLHISLMVALAAIFGLLVWVMVLRSRLKTN